MANRLQLNFQLQTTEERTQFVGEYVEQETFKKKPLTNDELETIANYILWGKDKDGLNCTQRKEIQIETKNKTWNRQDTESLDAMMESPTFNEAVFKKPTEARTKVAHVTFDRELTLAQCPSHLKSAFIDLFHRIDSIELAINFYELAHNQREKEPRAALLNQFSKEEIQSIQDSIKKWNQYKYLKQRHLIVELRREQFTLRDSFVEHHVRKTPPEPDLEPVTLDFDVEVPVYPLGLVGTPTGGLVFRDSGKLHPKAYSAPEIEKAVKYYWDKKSERRPQLYFDFCELEHVYELFNQLNDLEESVNSLPLESNLGKLAATLRYYINLTDLTEAQKEILDLKINKVKNEDIAIQINKKYDKSYTANYISTIFRQKIIPRINDTAAHHAEIISNLTFEENFKRCNCCGQILLIDAENFVRKSRAKDGFASKCKICDRKDRQSKKVGK